MIRGSIALARGDDDRADAESRYALDLARAAGDPQALHPVLQKRAEAELEFGARAEAREHCREAIRVTTRAGIGIWLADLTLIAVQLGVEEDIPSTFEALERLPSVPISKKLLAHD